MLKKSILGFFQLVSPRNEFALDYAYQGLASLSAPGLPCPARDVMSRSSHPLRVSFIVAALAMLAPFSL